MLSIHGWALHVICNHHIANYRRCSNFVSISSIAGFFSAIRPLRQMVLFLDVQRRNLSIELRWRPAPTDVCISPFFGAWFVGHVRNNVGENHSTVSAWLSCIRLLPLSSSFSHYDGIKVRPQCFIVLGFLNEMRLKIRDCGNRNRRRKTAIDRTVAVVYIIHGALVFLSIFSWFRLTLIAAKLEKITKSIATG